MSCVDATAVKALVEDEDVQALKAVSAERFAKENDSALQKLALSTLKKLFDVQRAADVGGLGSGLEELPIEGFEAEQIWAMVSLENQALMDKLEKRVSSVVRSKNVVICEDLPEQSESETEEEDLEEDLSRDEEDDVGEKDSLDRDSEDDDDFDQALKEVEGGDDGDEQEDEEESEQEMGEDEEEEKDMDDDLHAPTEMDDDFFTFADMEKFVDSVEEDDINMKLMLEKRRAKEAKLTRGAKKEGTQSKDDYSDDGDDDDEGDEEEDEFDEDDDEDDDIDEDDEEGANLMFDDFWGKGTASSDAKSKKGKLRGETGLSSFEKQQLEIRKQIDAMEEEALDAKPWELRGEAHAFMRPKNSLLDKGDLDVDYLNKPAPVITEESTLSLEDMIRQRILDNDYDDVVRKLPLALDADYRPKAELSVEKSKLGLAEEYAKDYEQKFLGHTSEEVELRQKDQEELHEMFTALCHKLDALSNLYYTPKAPSMEGEVQPIKDAAAIEMEEALPIVHSAAGQAAPEQIMAKKRGRDGVGKTVEEMDQQERKALRQSKKTEKRARKRQLDAKEKIVSRLNPGLGNKHAKKAMMNDASEDVNWNKSSSFFKQLQSAEDTPSTALSKTAKATAKLSSDISSSQAAAFRL